MSPNQKHVLSRNHRNTASLASNCDPKCIVTVHIWYLLFELVFVHYLFSFVNKDEAKFQYGSLLKHDGAIFVSRDVVDVISPFLWYHS